MYSPVTQVLYVDKTGKEHIRRVFGLKQSSAPGRNVIWNRDCNAPRNFIIREQAVQSTGLCVVFSIQFQLASLSHSSFCAGFHGISAAPQPTRRWSTRRRSGMRTAGMRIAIACAAGSVTQHSKQPTKPVRSTEISVGAEGGWI